MDTGTRIDRLHQKYAVALFTSIPLPSHIFVGLQHYGDLDDPQFTGCGSVAASAVTIFVCFRECEEPSYETP